MLLVAGGLRTWRATHVLFAPWRDATCRLLLEVEAVARLAAERSGCPRRPQSGEPRWRECGALPLRTRSDDLKVFAEPLTIATEQKPVGDIAQPRQTEARRVRGESDRGPAEGVPVLVPFADCLTGWVLRRRPCRPGS